MKDYHSNVFSVNKKSAIAERNQLSGKYMSDWLVDRFFIETVGIPFEDITRAFAKIQDEFGSPSFREPHRLIVQVSTSSRLYHGVI